MEGLRVSKKSLRLAIDTHERLTAGIYRDGSYGDATGDDRKPIFNKRMLEIEPVLKTCPFCNELPVFEPSCLSRHGICANGGGWLARIECENCDMIFNGAYGSDIVEQWNNRQ